MFNGQAQTYLGDWHTHPGESYAKLSRQDQQTLSRISRPRITGPAAPDDCSDRRTRLLEARLIRSLSAEGAAGVDADLRKAWRDAILVTRDLRRSGGGQVRKVRFVEPGKCQLLTDTVEKVGNCHGRRGLIHSGH